MKQTNPIEKSKRWIAMAFVFLTLWVMAPAGLGKDPAAPAGLQVLARVEVPGSLGDIALPVFCDLIDGAGRYYALVIATQEDLKTAGVDFRVIDEYLPGTRYLIALERRPGARKQAAPAVRVLYDDGLRIIVKESLGLADTLGEMGFALKLMSETPIILTPTAPEPRARELMGFVFTPDPLVSQMIGMVSQDTVNSYISGLSGESPVTVEGAPYTIATRHTNSGTPLQKATQYVFERLQQLGLNTSFQDWSHGSSAGRNVVGELRGANLSDEIVLLTAHLDNLPSSSRASPGADDNASGSAALLMAADIMSRYRFQRTIRFVFFTGEEQGLYGSARYASSEAGRKIVAVLNLDMIAYNTQSAPKQRLHTRAPANPGYSADRAIANTFIDVVNNYGMAGSLQPIITSDGDTGSDHSSFWDKGFAAIMVIEDDWNNFNPYYHTASDKLQYLNLAYCTVHVKAAVGTGAHLASPLPRPFTLTVIKSGADADTVTSSPPGINCGSECSKAFDAGSVVTLTATAGGGSVFTGWSGGGCSGTSTTCQVTMDADKTVTATMTVVSLTTTTITPSNGGGGGGGCFIATAAFGSPMERHVQILRDFRDRYLLHYTLGQKFVHAYYQESPQIAETISKSETLRLLTRWFLMPVIGAAYLAIHFGIMTTLMIIAFAGLLLISFVFALGKTDMFRKY
jgi:hypothetical protein